MKISSLEGGLLMIFGFHTTKSTHLSFSLCKTNKKTNDPKSLLTINYYFILGNANSDDRSDLLEFTEKKPDLPKPSY